ncbi:MAG: AfsA-related hotdog domain-containing protein [Methylovirgula sp.]
MITFDTIIIVGNSFSDFSKDKPALTVSQLEALIRLPPTFISGKKCLVLGQGVADHECSQVLKQLKATPELIERFDASHLDAVASRAPQSLSHKRKNQNTLISRPEQIGEALFSLSLLVDENSEFMDDHQTGQHIQGMVQIEALRQSFLAVTEAFFPVPWFGPSYFVINGMEISFHNFLFPLPAQIHYRSIEADINERRARHIVEIEIRQNGQICSACQTKFVVYPSSVISEKEAKLATSATEEFLRKGSQSSRPDACQEICVTAAAE